MNTSATTLQQIRPLLPIRLLNGCGVLLEKARIPICGAHAVDLIETAKRRCGLDDFGDGDFFEALSRLIESCHSEARLSLIGKIALRIDVLQTLFSRLQMERDQRAAKSAGCGPGASMSPDVGSDDAISTYSRH